MHFNLNLNFNDELKSSCLARAFSTRVYHRPAKHFK